MAKFTVRKGKRYRATIKLTGLKRLASNETIAGVFRGVGFAEIRVEGTGGTRYAEALWPKEDASAEIPPEVVKVEEIGAEAAPAAGIQRAPRKRAPRKPRPRAKPRRKVKRKVSGKART